MTIISFNGIERIGKSYYCGIINNYLKDKKGEDEVKKFSFPSYSTHNGKKLASLIKQFKSDDLLSLNPHSHNRYKRIISFLLKNYEEYEHFIETFLARDGIALINNNYFSIIAHALAADITYNDVKKWVCDIYLAKEKTLAFFLVSNDVQKTLTTPYRSHEYHEYDTTTISEDYINYFKMVNNIYKQIYLTYFHKDSNITPVLIEINPPDDVSDTIDIIKQEITKYGV